MFEAPRQTFNNHWNTSRRVRCKILDTVTPGYIGGSSSLSLYPLHPFIQESQTKLLSTLMDISMISNVAFFFIANFHVPLALPRAQ